VLKVLRLENILILLMDMFFSHLA